ncbi:MAG TPA: hypothetical protein VJ960_00535 [Oceanipulchritudo sp.]|nr:hypothetical protein [Oceanipulchritudo sp.]
MPFAEEQKERMALERELKALVQRCGGRYLISIRGHRVSVQSRRKCGHLRSKGQRVWIPQCSNGRCPVLQGVPAQSSRCALPGAQGQEPEVIPPPALLSINPPAKAKNPSSISAK